MIRTTRGTQQWVTYLNRLLLLALIFVATWTLPYFVPVAKTISVSYTTQYNNRAATLVFALGSLLYAWFTRGEMGQVDPKLRDWPLTTTSLGPALLGITLLFWAERLDTPLHGLLGESFYCLDRFQMLVQGRVPYRDFEFAYGPLQLYVPLLLYKVVHMRPLSAYAMWLWMQWAIGITMLWYVLRTLPLLLRWRPLIFWSLVVWYYPSMMDESMMYTPLRACYAAFAVTIVHRATVREGSKWQGVTIAFFATALGLGISPEQGVAVAAGLVLWFAILVFYKNAFVRLPALLAFVAGLAAIFGVAYREHMFKTLLDFSSGAFCYPICPSAHVAVVLSCYVAAACYATRFLRARDFTDISVPMLTAGLALLPAAFGRADLGHLAMASPILLLGIGAIQQQNITRRIWTIGAFIGFVGPAALAGMRIAPAVFITALHAKVWQQRGGLLQASNLSTVPWHFPCATVLPERHLELSHLLAHPLSASPCSSAVTSLALIRATTKVHSSHSTRRIFSREWTSCVLTRSGHCFCSMSRS